MTSPENMAEAHRSEVSVAEAGTGTYTRDITTGHHRLVADEPRPSGDNAGPSPYELLLAALGACTSMTVRHYAERNGWPLEQVLVTVRHSRIHTEDCVVCETGHTRIDHIDVDIWLAGELDQQQRERLLHIAEQCPVHRTLASQVSMATSLQT